jgi:outer membrane protein assembly factor BamB
MIKPTLLAVLALAAAAQGAGQDWPQWRGLSRDGVWKEKGLVERFADGQLAIKWRVPVGSGYSGPTVANGRVYITDRITEPASQERVHCFEWATGKPVWTFAYDAPYGGVSYPAGPRASVTVHDGRAYAIGAVGHFYCFDAVSGKVQWSHDLGKTHEIRMPDWGISAAPIVEKELVVVHVGGNNGACLIAFDRKTGIQRWKALDDRASYSAPIVVDQAGKRVLICWTADRVVGLDPEQGSVYWAVPFPASKWPIAVASPVLHGERIFLTSAIDGAMMLRLKQDKPEAEVLWHQRGGNDAATRSLQSLISTPFLEGEHIYGVDLNGELRCLDAKTGERVWESLEVVPKARWAAAHLVRNGDRTWIFNERGQLIIATLTPRGYQEISRAQLLKPTLVQLRQRGGVCWSHPAFAYRHVFARNDEELVCANLAAP